MRERTLRIFANLKENGAERATQTASQSSSFIDVQTQNSEDDCLNILNLENAPIVFLPEGVSLDSANPFSEDNNWCEYLPEDSSEFSNLDSCLINEDVNENVENNRSLLNNSCGNLCDNYTNQKIANSRKMKTNIQDLKTVLSLVPYDCSSDEEQNPEDKNEHYIPSTSPTTQSHTNQITSPDKDDSDDKSYDPIYNSEISSNSSQPSSDEDEAEKSNQDIAEGTVVDFENNAQENERRRQTKMSG